MRGLLVGCRQIQNHLGFLRHSSSFHYVQGQSPEPGTREYFYYVDHQGMLFMDDARIKNFTSCFKDVAFLEFFFKRLRVNDTAGPYQEEFPYISPCGRERNYVRCDDLPVVFTSLVKSDTLSTRKVLLCNYCGPQLAVPFQPSKLYMGSSGRIYHPGPERLHGIGLIKSQMAIDFSKDFQFDAKGTPTHFTHEHETFKLDHSLKAKLLQLGRPE